MFPTALQYLTLMISLHLLLSSSCQGWMAHTACIYKVGDKLGDIYFFFSLLYSWNFWAQDFSFSPQGLLLSSQRHLIGIIKDHYGCFKRVKGTDLQYFHKNSNIFLLHFISMGICNYQKIPRTSFFSPPLIRQTIITIRCSIYLQRELHINWL